MIVDTYPWDRFCSDRQHCMPALDSGSLVEALSMHQLLDHTYIIIIFIIIIIVIIIITVIITFVASFDWRCKHFTCLQSFTYSIPRTASHLVGTHRWHGQHGSCFSCSLTLWLHKLSIHGSMNIQTLQHSHSVTHFLTTVNCTFLSELLWLHVHSRITYELVCLI